VHARCLNKTLTLSIIPPQKLCLINYLSSNWHLNLKPRDIYMHFWKYVRKSNNFKYQLLFLYFFIFFFLNKGGKRGLQRGSFPLLNLKEENMGEWVEMLPNTRFEAALLFIYLFLTYPHKKGWGIQISNFRFIRCDLS
jgi:hypothetical protein